MLGYTCAKMTLVYPASLNPVILAAFLFFADAKRIADLSHAVRAHGACRDLHFRKQSLTFECNMSLPYRLHVLVQRVRARPLPSPPS